MGRVARTRLEAARGGAGAPGGDDLAQARGRALSPPRGGAGHGAVLLGYLVLQAALFAAPGAWLALPAVLILLLGARAGVPWPRWVRGIGPLLPVLLLPALAGLPDPAEPGFWPAWAPALRRSLVFLLVLASAAWLAARSSPVELRDTLVRRLRPLGRPGRRAALAASLALAFLPWARTELRLAGEAARLRGYGKGGGKRGGPGRSLARAVRRTVATALPVAVRALEKARRSAEALELRGPGSW